MKDDSVYKPSGLPVRGGGTSRFPSLSMIVNRQKEALLLDVSISMSDRVDGVRKIDRLREAILPFREVRRFVFSSYCYEVTEIPEPNNTTALHHGLETVKGAGVNHIILVTDGQPDSEDMAFKATSGLKINAIFVGYSSDVRAQKFLQELCRRTGGRYGATVLDLQGVKELTSQIAGLLEGGVR